LYSNGIYPPISLSGSFAIALQRGTLIKNTSCDVNTTSSCLRIGNPLVVKLARAVLELTLFRISIFGFNTMIGISRLYIGKAEASDSLRYSRKPGHSPAQRKPIVVWNATKRCNLLCQHCYSSSESSLSIDNELTTAEAKTFIGDLAKFAVPVLLFSGGEPLMRQDIPELAKFAVSKGLRAVISTNGTLINASMAKKLKDAGVSYVGISLDGSETVNDKFREKKGAFAKTISGIRACNKAGLKVGIRFTITKKNYKEVPFIFDLIEKESIQRACFYHLVCSGRGSDIRKEILSPEITRKTVDLIIDRTANLHKRGICTEVLTVDNHCDGPYLYLRMLKENSPRAKEVLDLLEMTGGNSSGVGIACVSWDGTVYPDQFMRNHPVGNIREKPFSGIWPSKPGEFLQKLREKHKLVTGRCAKCRFLDVCAGNFRARTEALTGDLWASDPACYLNDREIKTR